MPLVAESRTPVAIVHDSSLPPRELLERVAAQASLWDELASATRRTSTAEESPRIVIKPEIGGFRLGSPAATDPLVVELLIDLLHDRGYSNVSVVATSDSSSLWADNRDVMALADLLGYRYQTPAGRPYDVLDLAEQLEPVSWPVGSVLCGSELSETWTKADFRIVFAKNRTDEADGYALCLDTLIGILPLADKNYYYRYRLDPGSVVADILETAPPQFAFIDALVSAHGNGGSRAPQPLATATLIASPNVLLADYVAAMKMGIDPHISRLTERALAKNALPRNYRIDGSVATYPGWRAVHALVTDATRKREGWIALSRTIEPWLRDIDRESFPFKNPVDARANEMLAPHVTRVDENDIAFAMLVLTNYCFGWIYQSLSAYRTMYDKDGLRHRLVPLGIDPKAFDLTQYEAAMGELEALRDLLSDESVDAGGLKWRYLGESVVFEIDRQFPVPFEEFVGAVDVSRTIQFMNDYIGGVAVPVAFDHRHRVTHQAERNLYLPQPNYLVLYHADSIDVTKLEHVQYNDAMHRMCWKTIRSENNSARYDDGIVTFARDGARTRVSIFGRQLFNIPALLQVVDLNPTLKNKLVSSAYTTFFHRTFANFEALLEGRDIRIGEEWHDPASVSGTEPLLTEKLGQQILDAIQKYGPLIERGLRDQAEIPPMLIDADGFAHFQPPVPRASPPAAAGNATGQIRAATDSWVEFWYELADAIRRDAAWQAQRGVELV